MASSKETVEQVFQILADAHQSEYIGEPISQLEHALQAAKIATDAGGTTEMILASLLHDIGHLHAPSDAGQMDGFGVDHHHKHGAQILLNWGFSETVAGLVEGHVEAKRFLVGQHPSYLEKLSYASQETLKRQGGAMTPDEISEFQKNPLHKEMLRLRVFDDQAKRVGWEVPALESYRDLMLAHLERKP